ncbi:MAG: RluA family pseudouridine synthase [Solobacterium sp.]|nr:RluA family pseudouridine synthase [Solobacterium sp.]
MSRMTLVCEEADIRIDKYIATYTELSRTYVQQLLEEKKVTVNGNTVRSSYKVSLDDVIEIEVPEVEPIALEAEDIPLDILYEDGDVIVINKAKGMVVHPAPGVYHGTLVNALLYHCKDLSGINGKQRPGIVHRIDKDTTGCLIVCKNDLAHEAIAKQIEEKTCHREYVAIVNGIIDHEKGLVDAPIGRDPRDRQRMTVTEKGSKEARTLFEVIERFREDTYISCTLETGRTHQIRAHMKYIGHPVMGDSRYGGTCKYMDTQEQVLHARSITFVHPRTQDQMRFEAPLPTYFEELLELLRKDMQ